MPHDFQICRVFCSTPGTLDIERDKFQQVTGELNENGGFEAGVLFAPVTCRGAAAAGGVNAAVRQNVRDAGFFIQILGTSWGPPAAGFDELFQLALDCRDDATLPMRDVVVLLKESATNRLSPDVAQFRGSIAQDPRVRTLSFSDVDDLARLFVEIMTAWRQLESWARAAATTG